MVDPRLDVLGNILVPLMIAGFVGFFLYLDAEMGVMVGWFGLIYKKDRPRTFWLLRSPFGLMAVGFCALSAANFWNLVVVPYLGNPTAYIVLHVSLLVAGAAIIATDFHFGHVWMSFRFGWPCPVWRDQNPGWFWFWEGMQSALYSLLFLLFVPELFESVSKFVISNLA